MIPTVKTWIVTLEDGGRYEVLAPTKRLAILNFRFDYIQCWGRGIAKVGLKRSK